MFIDAETRKRVNISAPYKGRSRLDTAEIRAEVGVIEIPDPKRESDHTHFVTESDDPPYVHNLPKPQYMLHAVHNAQVKQRIAEFEAAQARAIREAFLLGAESGVALLQSIDDQITALRATFLDETPPEAQPETQP